MGHLLLQNRPSTAFYASGKQPNENGIFFGINNLIPLQEHGGRQIRRTHDLGRCKEVLNQLAMYIGKKEKKNFWDVEPFMKVDFPK